MPFFRLGRHKNEKRPKPRRAATDCQRMVGNPEAVEVRSADRAFPINGVRGSSGVSQPADRCVNASRSQRYFVLSVAISRARNGRLADEDGRLWSRPLEAS